MLINKHIGFDSIDGQGIDGSSFQSELLYLDTLGKKRIQVWINSPGGSVIDGYSIYNAILKTNTPVDTYCVGIAASIAGVIFQSGRKRIMCDYGILMYHNPFGGTDKSLDAIRMSIVKMISTRSGIGESEIESIMNAETFIDASTAVEMGFADGIESSKKANTKYAPKSDVFAFHRECNTILNSIDKLKKEDMLKIKNRLNLADTASEDEVLKAIETIENKAKSNEEKLVELECEIEDKIKQYDTLKAELETEKEAKNKAELEAKSEKATTLVNEFVKVGKIENKAEVIEKWVTKAVEDFDGVKDLLGSIVLNKKAPETIENKVAPYTIAGAMAQINNKNQN
jgi:ATP-dependent Clp protease protease subunit